ncbi:MAG: EstA family serine hydrolase [Gammaproteobacteria bacterium]|nr:EstA family serine hydrolase [Gammaproteobacteria bacterium]
MQIAGHVDGAYRAVADAFIEGFESGRELGAALAVIVDGRTVVDVWHGSVDRRRDTPWREDTLVCMFSVTKAMTAVCLLQAVERGHLSLDAPIRDLWPEFERNGKQDVTLRQLMSHQAGLVGFHDPAPRETLYDWNAYVTRLADERPWWPPGTRHGYHAQTYGFLLGEVLRRSTGRGVREWFRSEVAAPLDIDFSIGVSNPDLARCADVMPARMRPEDFRELPAATREMMRDFNDPSTPTGAAFQSPAMGAGYRNSREFRLAEIPASNGHGTARAAAAMYDGLGRLLSPEVMTQATTTHSRGPDEVLKSQTHFGLGFMLYDEATPIGVKPGSFGHAGAGGSMAFHDPVARVSFCFAMNRMEMGMITGGTTAMAAAAAVYDCL